VGKYLRRLAQGVGWALAIIGLAGVPDDLSRWGSWLGQDPNLARWILVIAGLSLALGAAFLPRLRKRRAPALSQAPTTVEEEVHPQGLLGGPQKIRQFTVALTLQGKKWVRLAVTNNGPSEDFVAQVTEVSDADPEQAVPWHIRWRGLPGREVATLRQGETRLVDLAEADPMGGEGPEPWKQGQPIPPTSGWGRFRFHSPDRWFSLRTKDIRRGTADIYERQFAVTAAVRATSGGPPVVKRLRLGYDNFLNLRVSEEGPASVPPTAESNSPRHQGH
jgi:hypothetical protein